MVSALAYAVWTSPFPTPLIAADIRASKADAPAAIDASITEALSA
jgi:hypothetical protein